MKSLFVLIKPSSSLCNATCSYCFYEDISKHRKEKHQGFLQMDCVQSIIEKTLSHKKYTQVVFCFQGGEPLLIGYDFYEQFIYSVERKKADVQVSYSIQTNGFLLDDAFCKLFKQHDFLVGISLDGIQKTNDMTRFLNVEKCGSFTVVMGKIALLKSYEIPFNILSVLSASLYKCAKQIYNFYKKEQFAFIQFIPCLPNLGVSENEGSCLPNMYGTFYRELFSFWFEDLKKGNYMSIRLFDDIMLIFRGQKPSQCGMLGNCEVQCVMEADGSLYPCDFYVLDEYKLGNIKKDVIDNVIVSDVAKSFIDEKTTLADICMKCKFEKICGGGCKRQRDTFLSNEYCGKQEIYTLIYDRYREIEEALYKIERTMYK
ncbi:MAG: SPASM domain-containing protein [Breznakia sp.]